MAKTKRAAIYARMSKDDGDTEGSLGIKRQLADCHTLAEHEGWTVKKEHVLTDIASGYDRNAERPQFEKLIRLVKAEQLDVVVVYAIDRVSRRVRVTAEFADFLEDNDVDLWSKREGQASGVYLGILSALAQSESKVMSLRLKRKFEGDFLQEMKPKRGGNQPYGYKWIRNEKGQPQEPWFEIVEKEAAIVEEFAKRLIAIRSGGTEKSKELERDLRDRGIKTPRGNDWIWKTIKEKVLSPTTAGYMRHGDLIRKAPWPPIVSEEQWLTLNDIFNRTIVEHEHEDYEDVFRIEVASTKRGPFRRVGVLSGLVFSEKGSPMTAATNGQKRHRPYKLYTARNLDDNISIRRDVLEDYVFARIEERMVLSEFPPPGAELSEERTIVEINEDLAGVRDDLRFAFQTRRTSGKSSKATQEYIEDLVEQETQLQAEAQVFGEAILQPVTTTLLGQTVELPSIRHWLESADLQDKLAEESDDPDFKFKKRDGFERKRALAATWIDRIEITANKAGELALKKSLGITTNKQWSDLKDDCEDPNLKTRLKTEYRTTIYWKKGYSQTIQVPQQLAEEGANQHPQ